MARGLVLGLVVAFTLAVSPRAAAEEYSLDTYHTSVHFAVSHNDISYVRGRFAKLRGSVQYDAQARTGAMVISVQTNSIDTGNTAVDNVLRSEQFLDADRYPEVHFASDRFVVEDGKLIAIEGKLTLHGVQRPLRIEARRFICREVPLGLLRRFVCGGDFRAVLKRSEFGMTRFLPEVGDEVELEISGEAVQ
jgi:polyisoprenoid-binding protein YceI